MVLDRSPALNRVFHAVPHPARRNMLRALAAGEPWNLAELARPLPMSFPSHVGVLERAGARAPPPPPPRRADARLPHPPGLGKTVQPPRRTA